MSEQTQYNLLNRAPELEVLPAALDFGIGIMAYMPLAGGLLAGKLKSTKGSRTQELESEYDIRLGQENEQLAEFSALCRDLGETEAVTATAWTLQHPAVTTAIVGIHDEAQLDTLVRASEVRLEEDAIRRLNRIFDINKGRKLRQGAAPEAYSW